MSGALARSQLAALVRGVTASTPRRAALVGLLLLTACPSSDPGGDAGECTIPADEAAPSEAQRIVLSNVGATPIFVVPARDCSDSLAHALSVDGLAVDDDVLESCATLINHGCDSCDESDYGRPPLRIDPGASFEWSFDAHVYESRSFAQGCGFEAGCWLGLECPAGVAVPLGAALVAELAIADSCVLGPECECPAGADSCELTMITADEMGFGEAAPRSVEFEYAPELTVVVPLAG